MWAVKVSFRINDILKWANFVEAYASCLKLDSYDDI